jgi:hypothetical protein
MDGLLQAWRSIPVLARPFLFIPLLLIAHALLTSSTEAPPPQAEAVAEAAVATPPKRTAAVRKFTMDDVRAAVENDAAFNERFMLTCRRHDPNDEVCRTFQRRGMVDVAVVTDRAVTQLHDVRWELTASARADFFRNLRETPDEIAVGVAKRIVSESDEIERAARPSPVTVKFHWEWVAMNDLGRQTTLPPGGWGSVVFRETGGRWVAEGVQLPDATR